MKEIVRRNQKKRLLYSKGTIALLVFLIIIAGIKTWDVYEKEKESKIKLEDVKAEAAQLESRKGALRKEIERLKTDRGLEEEIRKRYRVVREGEEMIVLIDSPEPASTELKEESFWSRIFPF